MPSDKFIAYDAYQILAEAYGEMVDTKPHNAYYERPATLSLLPEMKGMKVLDAGCGPGVYSEWLIQHGAEVVAIDATPQMVELARERLGETVPIYLFDLRDPLDFLKDETFDLVLSPLVMDYIEDWVPVFTEFRRILRPGGLLIFSVEHPFAKYAYFQRENYFVTERVEMTWRGFGTPVVVPSYNRPLEEMIMPLSETGFQIQKILEPRPIEAFKEKEPKDYEELSKKPGFMCIRAIKSSISYLK